VEWDDENYIQCKSQGGGASTLVYIMGVFTFKQPFGLCDELTQMIRDCWWFKEDGKRKMHYISWDSIYAQTNAKISRNWFS
jgi:hypothetical protein